MCSAHGGPWIADLGARTLLSSDSLMRKPRSEAAPVRVRWKFIHNSEADITAHRLRQNSRDRSLALNAHAFRAKVLG